MQQLLAEIRQCSVCAPYLAEGVRPVVAASTESRIVIIGQAPGRIVHHTGIPWNDKSGDNLRAWLGVDKATFYDDTVFALMPMGFCFPGQGKSGDLPPRPECAPLWHGRLLPLMPQRVITLLVGSYAQQYYLRDKCLPTLTATVKDFRNFLPGYLPLPHPSPRNNIWQARNPWFASDVLPFLKSTIAGIIAQG